MENFKAYITSLGRGTVPAYEEADALLVRYPWFTTARVVRSVAREGQQTTDALLRLHLSAAPLPSDSLLPVCPEDFGPQAARSPHSLLEPEEIPIAHEPSEGQIIDAFLDLGEYHITPPSDTPQEDDQFLQTDAGEEQLPGIVTEELADIYMKQELWMQAKSVYEKLSLLYPKKSVYFAKIMERIDARIQEQNN